MLIESASYNFPLTLEIFYSLCVCEECKKKVVKEKPSLRRLIEFIARALRKNAILSEGLFEKYFSLELFSILSDTEPEYR